MTKTIYKSVLAAGLALTFFMPVVSSADTISDLQAQIASLLAQIKVLQEQIAKQSITSTFCHTFNTNLGVGSSGDEVYSLSLALQKEGINLGKFDSYDEMTASAVSTFQQKYRSEVLTPAGLSSPTGYVGVWTRAKLNTLYGCSKPSFVSINGISGPQSLDVNQQGSWTVSASSQNGGNLSYSVMWGDEGYALNNSAAASGAVGVQQSATFTHTYSQAGTYKPTFTVTSENTIRCITTPCPSNAGSTQVSLSVNVGNVTTSNPLNVLSPNGGETWTKGTMQTIKWQDKIDYPTCPPGAYCVSSVPRYYDIQLVSYSPPCTTNVCTMMALAPHTIARNVYGSTYEWYAGQYSDLYDTRSSGIVSDGSYTIQICQTGTSNCDSSDGYFKLISPNPQLLQ